MKKLSALTLSTVSFFSIVPSAFAAADFGKISLCPTEFASLCELGTTTGIGGIFSSIILILFILAVVLALAFLIYGGIKWITSGGDKSKVEAARGTIVAALVGLVLVFLSWFIINLILTFLGITNDFKSFTLPTIGL